jgi:hypothetical protein
MDADLAHGASDAQLLLQTSKLADDFDSRRQQPALDALVPVLCVGIEKTVHSAFLSSGLLAQYCQLDGITHIRSPDRFNSTDAGGFIGRRPIGLEMPTATIPGARFAVAGP